MLLLRRAGATPQGLRAQRQACQRDFGPSVLCCAQQRLKSAPVRNKQSSDDDDDLDPQALLKYAGAIPLQVAIMTGALWTVQQGADALASAQSLPLGLSGDDAAKAVITLFFLVMSLKSRIFSPLPARRPTISSERAANQQGLRPWWCPPPIAFPIGWTIVALLRTVSSVIVWEASGREAVTLPLIVMLLQLSAGDCWNFIRNVEDRLGVATAYMPLNVALFYITVWQYWQVDPTAGQVLAPSALWITFAATIVWGTWDLGGRPALYPSKGESRLIEAGLQ